MDEEYRRQLSALVGNPDEPLTAKFERSVRDLIEREHQSRTDARAEIVRVFAIGSAVTTADELRTAVYNFRTLYGAEECVMLLALALYVVGHPDEFPWLDEQQAEGRNVIAALRLLQMRDTYASQSDTDAHHE